MWHLYHFPLCPFSRKVQLALAEKKVPFALQLAYPWDNDDLFHSLNPAGKTPVMRHAERGLTLADSQAICEYFEEVEQRAPLLPGSAQARAEIRRLVAMFDDALYTDVTAPLMHEKMKKRLFLRQSPDSQVLRRATRLLHDHLDYIDWLIDNNRWLGGAQLSLADFAAAAQLSVIDYLDSLDWSGHDSARGWYRVIKSRPSFAPLLSQRMEGLPPPRHYSDVNA
ncbi:MAG: glutathione S-transferase family protein [Erythrobacter sp.]|nr:glutathione S-transferase family protein [Erythrobacter sp.]